MRPPERLDAIDEADEAGPLLESAPPMPSSWIDIRSGAASDSASISTQISAVVRGCAGADVIGCHFGGFGQRCSTSKCTSTGTVQRRASVLSAGPSPPRDRVAGGNPPGGLLQVFRCLSVRRPWRQSGPSVRSVLAGLPSRRCVAAQCVDRFSCRARGAPDQPTASRLMSPDVVDERFADMHANGRAELKSAAVPAI